MDEWGQGPWFDPQGQGQEGEPAGQRPADASASQPTDTTNTDFLADEVGNGPDAGTQASGGYRMPPIPSRPLGPDRSYISGGPAGPGEWYSPPSGPFSQPVSQPLNFGGYSPPPRAAAAGGNGRGRRRVWVLLLAVLLLLVAAGSTAGILTGYIQQWTGLSAPSGGPNLGFLDSPTATATALPTPTATPAIPVAATITFTTVTTLRSSASTITSCPHGCNIVGNTYGSSKGFSGSYPASFVSHSHILAGTIHVTIIVQHVVTKRMLSSVSWRLLSVSQNVSVRSRWLNRL